MFWQLAGSSLGGSDIVHASRQRQLAEVGTYVEIPNWPPALLLVKKRLKDGLRLLAPRGARLAPRGARGQTLSFNRFFTLWRYLL